MGEFIVIETTASAGSDGLAEPPANRNRTFRGKSRKRWLDGLPSAI